MSNENEFQSTLPSQGATQTQTRNFVLPRLFQSTLPSQGATDTDKTFVFHVTNFNPRSPHRERPKGNLIEVDRKEISIHAPLTGSDTYKSFSFATLYNFNPRSPHRERRAMVLHNGHHLVISIHAPLTGSDKRNLLRTRLNFYFNPRSPHRERRLWFCTMDIIW